MRSRLRWPRLCASLCIRASSSTSFDSAWDASAAPQDGLLLLERVHLLAPRLDQGPRRLYLRHDVALALSVAFDGALQVGELGLQRLDFSHDLGLSRLLASGALLVEGQAL